MTARRRSILLALALIVAASVAHGLTHGWFSGGVLLVIMLATLAYVAA